MEFEDEIIGSNFEAVMQVMSHALKEYDQIVALAASEFFASMVQVWFMAALDDLHDESLKVKVDAIKAWLP